MKAPGSMLVASLLAAGVLACRPAAPGPDLPSVEPSARQPQEDEEALPPTLAPAEPVDAGDELDPANESADPQRLADLDGDWVPDSEDACPDMPEDLDGDKDEDGCPECSLPVGPCALRFPDKIRFTDNRAEIDPRSRVLLDDVVQILRDNPDVTIEIAGHTDSRGSARANLELSEQRAIRVREYLIDAGIAGERITVEGYGESVPIDTNETAAGRENNRRVELVRTDSLECPE